MACKLPVIVTDLPANREWVVPGINGWLAPSGDAEAFSSAILEALGTSGDAGEMAENNLAVTQEKADWEKNFTILLDMYERLYAEIN